MCMAGKDAYCPHAKTYGFEGYDTQGSVTSHAVRKEQWLFKIPEGVASEHAAPLMCMAPILISEVGKHRMLICGWM
jgi:D-arabinose 1-dehydrogenase-like Zn-dependent alcohol dehydrogenase